MTTTHPQGQQAEKTQFDYLLNAFEQASQSERPGASGYAEKRRALFAYVRALERPASSAQGKKSNVAILRSTGFDPTEPESGAFSGPAPASSAQADVPSASEREAFEKWAQWSKFPDVCHWEPCRSVHSDGRYVYNETARRYFDSIIQWQAALTVSPEGQATAGQVKDVASSAAREQPGLDGDEPYRCPGDCGNSWCDSRPECPKIKEIIDRLPGVSNRAKWQQALSELVKRQELSAWGIVRQALAMYQLIELRRTSVVWPDKADYLNEDHLKELDEPAWAALDTEIIGLLRQHALPR